LQRLMVKISLLLGTSSPILIFKFSSSHFQALRSIGDVSSRAALPPRLCLARGK
jgi:hypothetical protein